MSLSSSPNGAMGASENAELTELALRMAVVRRHPGLDLLHHSDRGTEFTAERYQAALHNLGIELISMSRTGNWDNAAMESVRRCAFFPLVGSVQHHKSERD
jgi:putative transposase